MEGGHPYAPVTLQIKPVVSQQTVVHAASSNQLSTTVFIRLLVRMMAIIVFER